MNRTLKAITAVMLITAVLFAVGCKKEKKAEVETSQVTNLTNSSATAGGIVTSDGGSTVVERGVCWSKASMPTVGDNHLTSGTGIGSFTCDITGLEPATVYYVRAYAINNVGIGYGSQSSFTTLASGGNGGNGGNSTELPVVTTSEVTNISENSATCSGNVTSEGGESVTERGVCWSTSHGPTVNDNVTSSGMGAGFFTANISGLTAGTTYYVRAYASNNVGTAYGEEVSFTTYNGLFSVSSQTKVWFSPGNLQYQASTQTWRFAEHQYDIIGENNEFISSTYNGWIDLFGWATSGWSGGWACCNPWDYNDYSSEYYGPAEHNLTGLYANGDWGVYNAISNGGNQAGLWRTLSQAEWDYVVNTRNTLSGARYVYAQVNEINGMILLPDNWNASTYLFNGINAEFNYNYSDNVISASNWAVLETKGAVFLPAAGERRSINLSQVNSDGSYWSSTYYYNYYNPCAYTFRLSSHYCFSYARYIGCSVRLVQNVQ